MSGTTRRWLWGGGVALLAIAAVGLSLLALQRVGAEPVDRQPAPVPTFTQPDETPLPSAPPPTPTASGGTDAAAWAPEDERFLMVGSGALWRGTAGQCGSVAPTLERSIDDGETWTDITPTYKGIGQLLALTPFAGDQAEIVALMGDDCEVQALRTFTYGQFWDAYDDALAAAWYVDPSQPGTIIGAGEEIAAPCAGARELRTAGDVRAVLCDTDAFVLSADGDEWIPVDTDGVAAVAATRDGVIMGHAAADCDGLAVSVVRNIEPESVERRTCIRSARVAAPAAIAARGGVTLVWSGADWVRG
ncbi:hypothetical protein AB0O65_02355 [Microbacterium sp. NPDC077391]|uniref:hypothetical protein n=1 Tax=Microbacterium sp. NPDC077391 TaxID=3154765 RepID=UPI00342707D6